GTTLRQSILRILDRLHPRKIVVVSSAPQVRYPDYYGIDMSRLSEFAAFRAARALIRERGLDDILHKTYERCLEARNQPAHEVENHVTAIYRPFTEREISQKMAQMLTPEGIGAEVQIIFQSLEGMHNAIPDHPGDWYFSGRYPTPGGTRLVNEAFISFYESLEPVLQ
ncbi:MAG: amidophosphoribosyltransferase, partial [Paramuribaculum sp.]